MTDTIGCGVQHGARTGFDYDVAIMGLGYVGLPTSLAFREAGCRVLGVDVSASRLDDIKHLHVDVIDTDYSRLRRALDSEDFYLTGDSALLSRAAALVVCVPTPVDEHLVPDLELLRDACRAAVSSAVAGQLLILTSTTYVGCTWDLLAEPLMRRGLVPGVDVFVAFSPERINPGMALAHEDVPRVVGGVTPNCLKAAATLLSACVNRVHPVSNPAAAEMCKLVENSFRAVNIALANEFADICYTLKLNVTEIIEAAATKPYGFMPFYPGPGVGGHCIPCDPHYLLWQMRKARRKAPLIQQTMDAIASRPRQVVERAISALSDHDHHIHGAHVLIVGVAYKPDVEDLRESPALDIIAELMEEGATVCYYDRLIQSVRLRSGVVLDSVKDPSGTKTDLVIVHTVHTGEDLEWLVDKPIVLDTTYRIKHLSSIIRL